MSYSMKEGPYNLNRFIIMQDFVYESVKQELRVGRKETHWIWFIFPQYKGLGFSQMAQEYAIQSIDEARAYLKHPILGTRLEECVRLTLVSGRSAEEIFGCLDSYKFRSSLTLFNTADSAVLLFYQALEKLYGGERDRLTLDLLIEKSN